MELKFNGVSSEEHSLLVTNVKRGVLPPKSAQMATVPGKPGAFIFRTETDVEPFTVSFDLIGEPTLSGFEARKRAIAEWLDVDEPAPLVFDIEPDLTYFAIPDGNFDLERLGTYGSFDVLFIAPDPYARGVEKSGTVARVYPIFSRGGGIRYRSDGTEVTTDYPWYQSGKFGEAVLVEEGTTNLLTTASTPATEEIDVTQGADYTLSLVGTNPSAKIEHKRVESITNATLAKEGVDYSGTVNSAWDSGTLSGVEAVSDGAYSAGLLKLAKSGTDVSQTLTSDTDFNAGTFSGVAVYDTGTLAYIGLSNQPAWNTRDNMESLSTWNGGSTSGASVDPSGFIRVTSSASVNVGIDRRPAVAFTNGFTIDFRARTGDGLSTFYISDGSVVFSDNIPATSGSWSWFRIRVVNSSTGYLYKDGTLVKSLSSSTYSTQRILLGYRSAGTAGATYDFDAVYYTIGADYGAPPTGHVYEGTYISPGFDLSSVVVMNTSQLNYTVASESIFSSERATFTFEYQSGTYSGGSVTWDGAWNSTSPISKGESTANKWIRYRTTISIRDSGDTPWLKDTAFTATSGYKTTGYRVSPTVNISQVVKAASTIQSWQVADSPVGTSVLLETQYSLDGGTTWSAWTNTTNGGTIPGITQAIDLSNALFKYKFTLSSTDVAVTPSLDRSDYSFTTGYKPSQTFTIPAYSIDSIGVSAGSFATWTETTPTSTDILVESSLDGLAWVAVENGRELFPADTDLTGKSLYLRYTLSTSDTRYTPMMGSSLSWLIAQQEPSRIIPATSVLVLTSTNVDRWQLEAKPYATGWHAHGTIRNAETLRYKSDALNQAQGTIELCAYENGGNYERYLFDLDGTSRFSVYQAGGKYYIVFNGQQAIDASAPAVGWHHVAVRWNGTDIALFIDGSEVADGKLPSAVTFTGASWLYLGCRNDGTAQWNGLLDDLMISNIARNNSEILTHATSGQPMAADGQTVIKIEFDGTLAPDTTQDGITNEGTAPTFPTIAAEIADSMPYLRVSNGAEFVYIDREFVAGDIVEIDCERALATVNGVRVKVSLDSDFFALAKGAVNLVVDPVGGTDVTVSFTERWK